MESNSPATQEEYSPDKEKILADLRDALIELYPTEQSARVVVHDAGLKADKIAFNSSSKINWHNILAEARKQTCLDKLLEIACKDYPKNEPLAVACNNYHRWSKQIRRPSSKYSIPKSTKTWLSLFIIVAVVVGIIWPYVSQQIKLENLICSDNILSSFWHLEANGEADEKWMDFPDDDILKGKYALRITYNLHGHKFQEGENKNDASVVLTQPNWYGVSLASGYYGENGLDGIQTVDIPLLDFVELPNAKEGIEGGQPLDLNEPVSSIRARFWHRGPFVVEITSISTCDLK